MSYYQSNPDMAPDSDFVSGEIKHLVVGNSARMLDPRRTPVRLVDIVLESGFFVVEVLDFEDSGARWELPLEWAGSFQFVAGSAEASAADVAAFHDAVSRLGVPLQIEPEANALAQTEARIVCSRLEVGAWLEQESVFLRTGARLDFTSLKGEPALWADLHRLMEDFDLLDLEDAFASQYVSNPYSGETVKGHCIVLAELGLATFDGTQARDSATFTGPRSKDRRTRHIVTRLAFVREIFGRLGHSTVPLYRGASFDGPQPSARPEALISATFSLGIATDLFDDGRSQAGVLSRQLVAVDRLFMTFLETEQMNRQYAEAEAILIGDGQLF